jgi:polysaccharide export outer membrane protein
MKNTSNLINIGLFLFLIVFSGCNTQKEIAYFQHISSDKTITTEKYESIISSNDLLSIVVSSLDPLTSAPFNLPIVSYASPTSDQLYTQPTLQSYLVDKNGEIEFPVIGKIEVGGLKKTEAVAVLQEKLSPYLKNPIVNIRITNYGISVLGEVNRPGTFIVPNERITILEAIALAGDLTIYGKRNNIIVIRENENGEKTMTKMDLSSNEIFSSPCFYLRQNDVVYIEPNKTKANYSSYNPNSSIIISAISTAVSVVAVIFSIVR